MNTNNELEQIREQMQVLKNKLDKQEIINDKLVTRTIKGKMSWIKKFIYFEFILVPIFAILWLGIKAQIGLSWYNYIFAVLMMSLDVYWDYKVNLRSINDSDYEKSNLIETAKKMAVMKKQRAKQMFISMLMVCTWLIWTGIEMFIQFPQANDDFVKGNIIGGFAGLVIGGVAGTIFAFKIFNKMQKTNDEIIEQIAEATSCQEE